MDYTPPSFNHKIIWQGRCLNDLKLQLPLSSYGYSGRSRWTEYMNQEGSCHSDQHHSQLKQLI
eukprot:9415712-Prorocentrum_lima.AAC.1